MTEYPRKQPIMPESAVAHTAEKKEGLRENWDILGLAGDADLTSWPEHISEALRQCGVNNVPSLRELKETKKLYTAFFVDRLKEHREFTPEYRGEDERKFIAAVFAVDTLVQAGAKAAYEASYKEPVPENIFAREYATYTLGGKIRRERKNSSYSPPSFIATPPENIAEPLALALAFDAVVLGQDATIATDKQRENKIATLLEKGVATHEQGAMKPETIRTASTEGMTTVRALSLAFAHSLYGVERIINNPARAAKEGVPLDYTGHAWIDAQDMEAEIDRVEPEILTLFGHGFPEKTDTGKRPIHSTSWQDVQGSCPPPEKFRQRFTFGIHGETKDEDGNIKKLLMSNNDLVTMFGRSIGSNVKVVIGANCFSSDWARQVTQDGRSGISKAIGYDGVLLVSLAKDFHEMFHIFYPLIAAGSKNNPVIEPHTVKIAFRATLTALYYRYTFSYPSLNDSNGYADALKKFQLFEVGEAPKILSPIELWV
jgi:hypothetical protein